MFTHAQQTWRANSIVNNCLVGSVIDNLRMLLVAQMIQHINAGIDHGHGIGYILAGNGSACVTGARLKDGILKGNQFCTEIITILPYISSSRDRHSCVQRLDQRRQSVHKSRSTQLCHTS